MKRVTAELAELDTTTEGLKSAVVATSKCVEDLRTEIANHKVLHYYDNPTQCDFMRLFRIFLYRLWDCGIDFRSNSFSILSISFHEIIKLARNPCSP